MVTTEKLSLKDYLADFMPSLENFISKCPLKVKSSLVQDTGTLYIEILDPNGKSIDGFNYVVHASKEKQSQIREIKEKLEVFYPIIYQETQEMYSADEIAKIVEEDNIPLADALKMRKTVTIKKFKIIRAHHRYNELDCYDFISGKMMKFKLKVKTHSIPTVRFLQELAGKPSAMSKVFFDAFEFKYILK